MAWNRPEEREQGIGNREQGARTSPFRGLIAAAIVVLGAAVAAWWLWPTQDRGKDVTSTKQGLIKEVTPNLTQDQQEKLEHPGMVKVRGKWYPEYNSQGGKIWVTKNWVRYHTPVVHTNRVKKGQSIYSKAFDNYADREIAILLNAPPGAMRIGSSRPYDERFTRQFLKSLETPIIISPDDSEAVAALKKAVRETKIDLKIRYDNGEDIAKIMNDTNRQLQELALYRNDLRKLVLKESRETKDKDARKGLYEAANKMLAERGVEPLKLPIALQRSLELQEPQKTGETK